MATGHLTNGQAWDCAQLAERLQAGASLDELLTMAKAFREEAYVVDRINAPESQR